MGCRCAIFWRSGICSTVVSGANRCCTPPGEVTGIEASLTPLASYSCLAALAARDERNPTKLLHPSIHPFHPKKNTLPTPHPPPHPLISASAHQRISASAHQRISASAHQRISASAHQRISASAHQRISASAHQRNPLLVERIAPWPPPSRSTSPSSEPARPPWSPLLSSIRSTCLSFGGRFIT